MRVNFKSADAVSGSSGNTRELSGPIRLTAYPATDGEMGIKLSSWDSEVLSSGDRGGQGKVIERTASVFLYAEDLASILNFLSSSTEPLPAIEHDAALMLAKRLIDRAIPKCEIHQ